MEKVEAVNDFIFLCSKIAADSDWNHEIKKMSATWKESESHSVTFNSLWSKWTTQSMEFSRPEYWKWVIFPFSRGSSQPRDQTQVSRIAGRFFTNWAMREAQKCTCPTKPARKDSFKREKVMLMKINPQNLLTQTNDQININSRQEEEELGANLRGWVWLPKNRTISSIRAGTTIALCIQVPSSAPAMWILLEWESGQWMEEKLCPWQSGLRRQSDNERS